MIQHRNHRGVLRIRNTPYGREVVFTPNDGYEEYRRRFINKQEAAEFFEKCKTEMEK